MNFFAIDKKNVKEQRARANAAFVVEVFFSEFVLPLVWGIDFQKNTFSRLYKQKWKSYAHGASFGTFLGGLLEAKWYQ